MVIQATRNLCGKSRFKVEIVSLIVYNSWCFFLVPFAPIWLMLQISVTYVYTCYLLHVQMFTMAGANHSPDWVMKVMHIISGLMYCKCRFTVVQIIYCMCLTINKATSSAHDRPCSVHMVVMLVTVYSCVLIFYELYNRKF